MNYSISIGHTNFENYRFWGDSFYYTMPLNLEVTYKVNVSDGELVYKFPYVSEEDIQANINIIYEIAVKFEAYISVKTRMRALYEMNIIPDMRLRELHQEKNILLREFYLLLDKKGFMFFQKPNTSDRFNVYHLFKK